MSEGVWRAPQVIRSSSPAPHAPLTAGAFSYDLWVSVFILEDDLATYTIGKRRET